MYYFFKNELKRKFKDPVLWILILIITVLLYINIERSYEANEFDNILKYDPAIIYTDEQTSVTNAYKEETFGRNYEEYNARYPGSNTPFISAIFNNVIVSLFATVGIYGGFYYLFRPFLYGKHYNLCPFTMNNGARIVAGTHNATMLTAAIILISSTILFLVIGLKYFKIKEI